MSPIISNRDFKVKTNISPEIMNDIFDFLKNYAYELRCGNCQSRSNIHFTHFGIEIESIVNIAAKKWNKIPNEIKKACFVTAFKSKIKKWAPEGCPCRLSETYMGQVGFI